MRPHCKILNSLRLSTWVVPLLMTSGCIVNDMKNTTDNMAQDTHEMRKKTAEMASTTDGMSKTTEKVAELTSEMRKEMSELKAETTEQLKRTVMGLTDTYSDLRQKEAVDMRNQMLETLEKTTALESKVVTAGKYCMAFEFQLWKNNLNDTPEYREQLFRDSMEEFLLDLARYMPDPNESLDPASSKARMQNLMAIAGTIDRVNPNAQVLARTEKQPQVSILSLIHGALKKADQVEQGVIKHEDLKPYEQQVLIYKSEAIALLKARANFLPVMLLSRISDIQSRSLPVQAWMAYYGSSAKFGNIEALRQGLDFISGANEEIRFLNGLGVSAQVDGTLKSLFNHMALPEPGKSEKSLALPDDKRTDRSSVEAALVKEINQFKTLINVAGQ